MSDLAAALLADAEQTGAYEPVLDAIVVARRAIATTPELAAAHFNLALALERIGLTNEARASFTEAARREPVSAWAKEARKRAADLRPLENDFRRTEPLLRRTDDPAERERLILLNLEGARNVGEGPYMAEWGALRVEGCREEAQHVLGLVRSIGLVLDNTTGERLLMDAVDAIDVAESRGHAQGFRMAKALVRYGNGRKAHFERNETLAISELSVAADALQELHSPIAYVARYYRANALYEDSRPDEALEEIEGLEEKNLGTKRYSGLAAQLGWMGGSCQMVRGAYAEALHRFNRSYAMSIAGGELGLAASFDAMAAQALEYLGQPREAWQRRSRALRAFSTLQQTSAGEMTTLFSAANLQLVGRNPERATALLDYTLPLAVQRKDSLFAVYTFAQRSLARAEVGDAAGSASDRARGRLRLKFITTASIRERMAAELDIGEGVVKRSSKPAEAAVFFTNAIDLLRRKRQELPLPHLLSERARAYEAAGDVRKQRMDLLAGRAVVADWEQSVRDVNLRAAIGMWGETFRRDLISLELGAKDVQAAFTHAEDRQTAAPTREPSRLALPEIQRALAPGGAIVELLITRQRVVAFIIRPKKVLAVTLPGDAARITGAAEALRDAAAVEAIRSTDEGFPQAAAALYDLIFAPIAGHLAGVTTLAVVPDREFTGISFGALFDAANNQYLIERMTVINDETADAAIRLSKRAREVHGSSLLAIGASVFDRERNPLAAELPEVELEASDVALQAHEKPLLGLRATPDAVRQRLKETDGVHFAGHIVGRGTDARMLLAPNGGHDGITAGEIAGMDLSRLRFVVLAACRGSSVGESNAVVRDMATGFLNAGAATVIASSTDVDDAAAPQTMRRLHAFLVKGGDPAEALRLTVQRDRRREGRPPLSVRLLVMGGTQGLVN
ncbi:MAG: CHAT domain-containing protein [Acidobacteriota bacterium]